MPKAVAGIATAFLGGAVLVNVMTEELPLKKRGRMAPFVAGVVAFTVIAMLMRSVPRVAG